MNLTGLDLGSALLGSAVTVLIFDLVLIIRRTPAVIAEYRNQRGPRGRRGRPRHLKPRAVEIPDSSPAPGARHVPQQSGTPCAPAGASRLPSRPPVSSVRHG